MIAKCSNHSQDVYILLNAGANLNQEEEKGKTIPTAALHQRAPFTLKEIKNVCSGERTLSEMCFIVAYTMKAPKVLMPRCMCSTGWLLLYIHFE